MDSWNLPEIRESFPALNQKINEKPLIYLDNAATTLKPHAVMNAIYQYYSMDTSNVHRSLSFINEQTTIKYETTRRQIKEFLNAKYQHEIIFTKGTTDSINLVANSYGQLLKEDDEIIISEMEHHSNIIPWQILAERTGATLKVIPIDDEGDLIIDHYKNILSDKTKIVAVSYLSNVLGKVNPISQICDMAHHHGAVVLVDGAQAVSHLEIDLQALDCDFFAFSAHKLYGPTGVGVLYGKEELLERMPPYQFGGGMIENVTLSHTTFSDLPHKFEAGTPNISGVIGLQAAISYLQELGIKQIAEYEKKLAATTWEALSQIKEIKILGDNNNRLGIFSFLIKGAHSHDVGTFCDNSGIVLRTGQHCCQPLMDRYKTQSAVRASLAFYNSKSEIEQLTETLIQSIDILTK